MPANAELLTNFASSTLTAGINAAAVSLTIKATDAAKFPVPTASQGFAVVLQRRNTGEREVVYCSARAAGVLTVTRAQEGTAALTFVASDIVSVRWTKGVFEALRGRVFYAKDFGAVGNGVADDTAAFQAINAARIAASATGGGTIVLEKGASYKLWSDNVQQTILDFSNAVGVTIEGNGATIVSGRTTPANGNSIFIYGNPMTNMVFRNLKFIGTSNTVLPVDAASGERFINWTGGSKNLLFENIEVRNCLSGPGCVGNNGKNRGVTVRNLYCERVFYPFGIWCTDDVVADYTAIECGRAYFPVASNGYGCNNHDITLYSIRGYGDVEMLFGLSALANADLTGDKKNEFTNIKVRYKSPGKAASALVTVGSSSLVQFGLQQQTAVTGNPANSGKFHINNIDIQLDVDGLDVNGGTLSVPRGIFNITKLDANGASDATVRGYVIDNVRLSGVARNWQTSVGGGITLFDTAGGMSWVGEKASNISFDGLKVLNTGAAALVPVTINGQPAIAGVPFLDMDRVYIQGDLSYVNCTSARIREGNIYFSNLAAARAFTPVWTGSGSNPVIGNGTITGYRHRDGEYNDIEIIITPGSTTTFGTGQYEVQVAGFNFSGTPIGLARGFDSVAAIRTGNCIGLDAQVRILVYFGDPPSQGWAATYPWTFKNGDQVILSMRARSA